MFNRYGPALRERRVPDRWHKTIKMKKKVRVDIPRSADKMIALASEIIVKHQALGGNSPLISLDMQDMQAKLQEAEQKNHDAKDLRRQSEEALEARNLALGMGPDQVSTTPGTLLYYITASRDMLLALYRGKEHKLGSMGFDVHSSPRAADNEEEVPPPH